MIAVTQSGETADTLAATRLARERGAPIVAITNVVGGAITRAADETLYLQAGPEISVTSTKTFITTTTVLSLIGLWLGRHVGSLIRDELQETLAALRALPAKMRRSWTKRQRTGPLGATGGLARWVRKLCSVDKLQATRSRRGRARTQGDLVRPRRGVPGGRVEAWANRLARPQDSTRRHRHAQPHV